DPPGSRPSSPPNPTPVSYGCACCVSPPGRTWERARTHRGGASHGFQEAGPGCQAQYQEGPASRVHQADDRQPSSRDAAGPRPPGGQGQDAGRQAGARLRGPDPARAVRSGQEEGDPRPLEEGQVGSDRGDPQGELSVQPLRTSTTQAVSSCGAMKLGIRERATPPRRAAARPSSIDPSSPTEWASVPIDTKAPASFATPRSSTSRSCRSRWASISRALPEFAVAPITRGQSARRPIRTLYRRPRGWASTWTSGFRSAAR